MSVDPAAVGAQAIGAVASRHPDLDLVVLFGSRARGDASARSDWDLGYTGAVDRPGLLLDLVTALGTEKVDLVDLDRAGGLLRYRAARDGVPIFERTRGVFDRFWLDAVRFWCDAHPILEEGYAELLAELDR